MGAYTSVPTWWRNSDSRYRLVMGECPECGTMNFPPTGACVGCSERVNYTEVEADGTGTILATTVIESGAPPEFVQLLESEDAIAVAVIELDEGARVPAMVTDCNPHAVERGDRVKSVVRKVYEQEGVVRYGTKFRPMSEQKGTE